jgi:uncharacterized protein (TIGR02145 family)
MKIDEIQIGNQSWMMKNLNVDKFRNGDLIQEAKTDEEWTKAGERKQPVWCYYVNNPKFGDVYGRLYNFYAISDKRGLAPENWRIPSNKDLDILIDIIGGEYDSSGVFIAGKKLKANKGWEGNGNGTNEILFSALPGGIRLSKSNLGDSFQFIGFCGSWWSSEASTNKSAYFWSLYSLNGSVGKNDRSMSDGLSVRCLRD